MLNKKILAEALILILALIIRAQRVPLSDKEWKAYEKVKKNLRENL